MATPIAGQNISGLSLTRANTAGSEPSGISVAAMKAMKKTVDRPTCGNASAAMSPSIQASIGSIIEPPNTGGRTGKNGENRAAILLPRFSAATSRPLMRIGHITLANRLFAAPMAGVTDRPFRQLCKRLGAGYAVSEMVTSRKDLWATLKTSRRADHDGETDPIAVQIAGTDAPMMAEAAAYNVARGAQIIDINMGCPAKKVCNQWAGSALMKDEPLALAIVEAVVAACAPHNVPVTLKMRTGWCESEQERGADRARRRGRRHRHGRRARPHARAGLQGRAPSTTPSPPSSARSPFRSSPTATSIRRRRRARCSPRPAPTRS